MLLHSGEHIVSSLDEEAGNDVSVAMFILDKSIKDFQITGLHGNTYFAELSPDVNNNILLPTNTCTITIADMYVNRATGMIVDPVIKYNPTRVFDRNSQTDEFDQPMMFKITSLMGDAEEHWGWDNLDAASQDAIMFAAAREYQSITQGDGDIDDRLHMLSRQKMNYAVARETSKKNHNILDNNGHNRQFGDRYNGRYTVRTRP